MADLNLFDKLRTVTQYIQYNVGEVYVTSLDMTGDKIRSSAPSMMLYQKMLRTGVFVGAVFQRLTCRFVGLCFETWTARIILLHNLTSQEHRNSLDWCFGLN